MDKDILNKPGKKSSVKSKKSKILTDNDIMKYEIASELGLIDKVSELGRAGLTAKEAGKIGGMLTSRKKQKKPPLVFGVEFFRTIAFSEMNS